MSDTLFEELATMTKANQYDAIKEEYKRLQESEKELKAKIQVLEQSIRADHEFPCESCVTGEYKQVGHVQPSGRVNYECNECSHEVSFP